MSERKVGVDTRLVEEGEASGRGEGEVRMRDA